MPILFNLLSLSLYEQQARALKTTAQPPTNGGPVPNPPPKGGSKLPPVEAQKAQQTDEILNSILPPR